MYGIVFLECNSILILSHEYYDGTDTSKQRVCPFVRFPCGDEVRQAIMEDLLVNLDFFRHGVER